LGGDRRARIFAAQPPSTNPKASADSGGLFVACPSHKGQKINQSGDCLLKNVQDGEKYRQTGFARRHGEFFKKELF
jgi:hypothetical protein